MFFVLGLSYSVIMNIMNLHISEGIKLQESYTNKEIDIILGNKEPNNTELFKLYHKCLSFNDVDTITRLMNMYDFSFINEPHLPPVSKEYVQESFDNIINTLSSILPNYEYSESNFAKKKNTKNLEYKKNKAILKEDTFFQSFIHSTDDKTYFDCVSFLESLPQYKLVSVWNKRPEKYKSRLFPQINANKWNKHTLVISLLSLPYWKDVVFQFIDQSNHPIDIVTYHKLKDEIIEMRNY